jgi:phosphomannomutase
MSNSKLDTKSVITTSNITFGTSGARGLVTDFRPEVCAAFVHAFLQVISHNFKFNTIYIAIDNRPSSYGIAQICAQAVLDCGYKVAYQGVVPTPALALCAMSNKSPCIMITGSHIPFDRNGLKFYHPEGEISKADELAIMNCHKEFSISKEPFDLVKHTEAAELYLNRYASLFDGLPLTGQRIGIYEHSSAGRDLYSQLFKKLGADVISLGRSDNFVPIDTEAVSKEDQEQARLWSRKFCLDAIFSTDGDGDRPLLSDENGNWLRGDVLGLLAAEALNVCALAVPVTCNTAIELSGKFECIKRTKIGSPYVIDAFDNLSAVYPSVAGFEANGGFLLATEMNINGKYLAALPTRDALLPALMVLTSSAKKKISALVSRLPSRSTWSDRIKNFPNEKSSQLIKDATESPVQFLSTLSLDKLECKSIDRTDGARFILSNDVIIHLRASGNAPELRCYVEAGSETEAINYVELVISHLSKKLTSV